MAYDMCRCDQTLVELTREELLHVRGGTDGELMSNDSDTESAAGTLIPVKVKHNV
jgi:hypothetical protein